MQGKEILKQLSPYKQGKQIKDIQKDYQLDYIVKLASNENPYGYSKQVNEALSTENFDFHIYPDGYTSDLRTDLTQKLNIDESEIIFGSGSEEIIQLLCRSYIIPGSNVVMATPTFPQYKHYSLIENAEIKEIPTDKEGYHQLDKMLGSIDDHTAIVWLCTPNNPTGAAFSKEELITFLDNCPKEVLVVLDEAYYEYLHSDKDLDALQLRFTYSNVIVLRTFSKAYGLAGLRIGYGIANSTIIETLDKVRGPFNTNSVAQKAASYALKDQEFIQHTNQENYKNLTEFQHFLQRLGWGYYDSEANFLLVKTPISGMDVYEYLLRFGFIVRPGELLGIPKTVRVTIGKEQDMKELQKVLEQFDHELG
ncbi:histidinol-phosphate transaminase [Oceanobacillus iheyensis]|uniref:Histidinol-phosphate aminotransferase 2 n=1 Tax=Oceanobacillus iheyensis (strain DSM 14371 / CIP 107618 / JCM 11309 / KCTC 3954 / HTE831) TaxID=221109 RepID=HIS82_OCEIH|nr:histidinol-phosphate transaminase [Oceanobacillus iheyensis]Q8EQB9.1 RecName: Full=Histidinol-phosphate aminotransferase 2; AltName: Full=Imidazole acetol-phosphate transaminase 2 [Oceanobacillus iheyensis HTE831]BAC13738.1 histidinol-phosphate aminotransferase [Oceanobacillus iheyensis HTE831]